MQSKQFIMVLTAMTLGAQALAANSEHSRVREVLRIAFHSVVGLGASICIGWAFRWIPLPKAYSINVQVNPSQVVKMEFSNKDDSDKAMYVGQLNEGWDGVDYYRCTPIEELPKAQTVDEI